MKLEKGQICFGNNMDNNGIRTMYAEGVSVNDNRKIKGSLLQVNETTYIYEGFEMDFMTNDFFDKLVIVNSDTVQMVVEMQHE